MEYEYVGLERAIRLGQVRCVGAVHGPVCQVATCSLGTSLGLALLPYFYLSDAYKR